MRKSYMLCLPAFTPVANDAHAVGDSGEWVVSRGRTPLPRFASFCMFGSLPSSIHFCTRRGSIPSKPRMTSFWRNFSGGRPPLQESVRQTTAELNSRRFTMSGSANYIIYYRAGPPPREVTSATGESERRRSMPPRPPSSFRIIWTGREQTFHPLLIDPRRRRRVRRADLRPRPATVPRLRGRGTVRLHPAGRRKPHDRPAVG